MADYRAIMSACEATVRMLRSSFDSQEFQHPRLDFQVYVANDFRNPPWKEGVSLFLYRIYHNGVNRTPPGRLLPDGNRERTKLPVDIHFLLTVWAESASLQHKIAGWMMRVMEDNPILPAGLLNVPHTGVFRSDETIEFSLTDLSVDDMFHIWDVMINHVYQLSVPWHCHIKRLEGQSCYEQMLAQSCNVPFVQS